MRSPLASVSAIVLLLSAACATAARLHAKVNPRIVAVHKSTRDRRSATAYLYPCARLSGRGDRAGVSERQGTSRNHAGGATDRPIRIAVVSDLHTMRDGVGEQPLYGLRLEQAINAVNLERPDLVLLPGDLTESGSAPQLRDFLSRATSFVPPVLFVPGNHDVGDKWTPGGDSVADTRTEEYEAVAGRSHFAQVIAGVRLVAVNASIMGSGSERDAAQWRWLDEEAALHRPGLGVLMIHYPLFLERPDDPGGSYWTVEPEPRARVLDFIRKARIRLVVSGHLHRPYVLTRGNVTFAGAPAISFGLPPESQPEGWTMITIRSDGSVSCRHRIVDHPDRRQESLPVGFPELEAG